MKFMILEPSEEEVIGTLTEYFDKRVQDSQRVQNVSMIKEFAVLPQREDYFRGAKYRDQKEEPQYHYLGPHLKGTFTLHHHHQLNRTLTTI